MSDIVARRVFFVGQRVELSEEGARSFGVSSERPRGSQRRGKDTGVVMGFGREPHIVRVRPDGIKTTSAWHATFWKPIKAEASK